MAIPDPTSNADAAAALQAQQWANAGAAAALQMANQIAVHNNRMNNAQENIHLRWAYDMSKIDPIEAASIKQAVTSSEATNDALQAAIAAVIAKLST